MRAMRTLGTLVVLGGTVVLVYGCSAAANAPVGDSPDAGNSNQDYGGGGDNTSSDASTGAKKDSGGGTGGGVYDAGPPKLPEGSPCDPTIPSDPQASESCGLCGTQTRICQGSAADGGGTFTWAAWGYCSGEVISADKCDPATTYTGTTCGNCGTMPQVCGSDCHFETGFDCTEPAGACHPTDIKFVLGASCTTPGQGRQYTCGSTCAFGSPSACEAPPPNPNFITLSTTAGATVNKVFTLSASVQTPRTSGDSCPTTLEDSTSFVDVAINNPTSTALTVSLWDGPSTSGGTSYDTVMAWYNTVLFPPPDRTACNAANDDCTTSGAECSGSTWSSLSGTDSATVPANGTITVYVGMYSSSDSGSIKIFAKREN